LLGRGDSAPRRAASPLARTASPLARTASPLARAGIGLGLGIGIVLALGTVRRRGHAIVAVRSPDDPAQRGKRVAAPVTVSLLAQVDLAIETLHAATDAELETSVHETRKAIKRSRSLLRLAGEQVPASSRKRANRALCNAGRALSGTRDADVALTTFEAVLDDARRRVRRSRGAQRLHRRLVDERDAARRGLQDAGARERALAQLWSARVELGGAIAATDASRRGARRAGAAQSRYADVAPGIGRIYQRGRRRMRTARRRRSIAEMHEWRKRVKDLRYGAEALGVDGKRGEKLRRIAARADKLGELLGEEHDLALLQQRLDAEKRMFRGERGARRELRKAIGRRRSKLRSRIFKDGERLYGRTRKRFLRLVRRALG
jgi:CHAD domain-containing protein